MEEDRALASAVPPLTEGGTTPLELGLADQERRTLIEDVGSERSAGGSSSASISRIRARMPRALIASGFHRFAARSSSSWRSRGISDRAAPP